MILRSLALLLFAALQTGPIASTPAEVVRQFCQLDSDGARLRSTAKDPIWQLTLDNGETPTGPVVLIESFKLSPAQAAKKTATPGTKVMVDYKVIGAVDERFDHLVAHPDPRWSHASFLLLNQDGGWKISLESFHTPPHSSVDAVIKHVDTLIHSIDETSATPQQLQKLKSLRALRRQLQKLVHA